MNMSLVSIFREARVKRVGEGGGGNVWGDSHNGASLVKECTSL